MKNIILQTNTPHDDLLLRFTQTAKELFGQNLTGIYLHGSAAMGCFHPVKSDLDLILVVEHDISDRVKMEFMKATVSFNKEAPAKGIELSIVKKAFCRPFVYPTPYELHFSNAHLAWFLEHPEEYIAKMKGTDKDLAAHFTVIQSCGITLCGEEPGRVFSPVPRADYFDSIWLDIENAGKEILNDPLYITLNLCRVLAFVRENQVCSKQSGGEWGLCSLPKRFHPLIQNALDCYSSEEEMTCPPFACTQFADYMLENIKKSAKAEKLI